MPSQVIEYQLGVLGREENRKYFSKALFNCLTVTRVEQVGQDYTFIKINNARYKATPSEMCQLAHENLLDDENYQPSILAFQERLEGIEFEMLQNRFEKLAEKDLDFMEDFEQSTMSEEEKVRKMSELEVLTTPFEERPKEGQTNINNQEPKQYNFYVCTGNEIKYLEAPLPENKEEMDALKRLEETIAEDKKNKEEMSAIKLLEQFIPEDKKIKLELMI